MKQQRLGFKLWKRKYLTYFKNIFYSPNNLKTILNILLTVFGILLALYANKLAKQSNKMSETALRLAQNDNSQQTQINQLKDILLEIKMQNDLAKEQTKQLLDINAEANEISKSNHDLIASSNKQGKLVAKQLFLSTKNDSIMTQTSILADESDLLILRKLFEEIVDVKKVRMLSQLHKSNNPDFRIVSDFRITLEKGMNNRLFLTDTLIKKYWYSYYLLVKNAELMINLSTENGGSVTIAELKIILKEFDSKYFVFVNKMLGRLNYLESIFAKKNYINLP